MILSFHPIIEADQNIICAGRDPNEDDLAAIQEADAVILSQGCSEALYRMARMNCPHIFPNLDARFAHPGKCSQLGLFRKLGLAHPKAQRYESVVDFHESRLRVGLPAVVKLDWGGQGDTVFKVDSPSVLAKVLDQVAAYERSGQSGFLVQEFIPTRHRSLRVVLIHTRCISYWRIQKTDLSFGTSITQGARIEQEVDQKVDKAAQKVVQHIVKQTGLQLAGIDFIFASGALEKERIEPLILEINYFFGRTGLGGSEAYYHMLEDETDKWLADLSLSR